MASSSDYQAIAMGTDQKQFTTPSIQHHNFLPPTGNNETGILLFWLTAIIATAFVSSYYYARASVVMKLDRILLTCTYPWKQLGKLNLRSTMEEMCKRLMKIGKVKASYDICPTCLCKLAAKHLPPDDSQTTSNIWCFIPGSNMRQRVHSLEGSMGGWIFKMQGLK